MTITEGTINEQYWGRGSDYRRQYADEDQEIIRKSQGIPQLFGFEIPIGALYATKTVDPFLVGVALRVPRLFYSKSDLTRGLGPVASYQHQGDGLNIASVGLAYEHSLYRGRAVSISARADILPSYYDGGFAMMGSGGLAMYINAATSPVTYSGPLETASQIFRNIAQSLGNMKPYFFVHGTGGYAFDKGGRGGVVGGIGFAPLVPKER